MRKLWVIARREYRATVRTKAFIIAIFLMPVMMGGGIGMQVLMEGRVELGAKKIAVLDPSGKLFQPLQQAAEKRNKEEIYDPQTQRQLQPEYILINVPVAPNNIEAQLLTLSDRVRKGELFAFIVTDPDILEGTSEKPGEAMVRYYSNQPTYEYVRRWLSGIINDRVISVRLAGAGIDREVVNRALSPVSVENLGLLERGPGGEIKEAAKIDEVITFGVPFGMMMLMFMALSITAGPLLNSVLEEKMQRIAEVLLGSVAPFELMFGKLLGYVGVAVTLVAFYLGGGFVVLNHYGYTHAIPLHMIIWFAVFQALSILMFGSLFLALGACCNDVKEAQNLMMPVWLLLCIPMFAMGVVIQHPNSLFSVVLSLFPPCTPMLMILRMSIPPGVPLWEPLVGATGTLVTMVICVWAAGRIFRVGLLLQGKPPKITEIARWVVRG
ncbi:MAG TPA: ABC transporter permease [Phycisphaerae bacterium]|nr:ABC transporter permease [Phycisphaerae bacterium]